MALTGGRMPYDAAGALTGPARVIYGLEGTAITPTTDLWDIIASVADANGEYPVKAGYKDFGLAADAPSYSHDKETEGIEYEQPSAELFEQISNITRSFTAQIAQIDPTNMEIVENTQAGQDAIAASAGSTAGGTTSQSALTRVNFGLYDTLVTRAIVLVGYRPSGAGVVTEPSGRTRPPAVALLLPSCRLAAEESEFEFAKGEPVNAEIGFTVFPASGFPAGEEHGAWFFESAGVMPAQGA